MNGAGPAALAWVSALTVTQLGFLTWWATRSGPAWERRGIKPVKSWAFTDTLALTGGVLTYLALLVWAPALTPWEASGAALTVFLTVLAVCTDVSSYRIPRDITLLTAAVAVPNLIAGTSQAGLVGVGFWSALVGGLFLARRFIGMGDVRLLFTFTLTLSWWVPVQWMLYAFVLAQGCQVLLTLAAKIFHFGASEPLRAGGKPRLHLPLAPALTVGYLCAITATVITGFDACASLSGAISCQTLI